MIASLLKIKHSVTLYILLFCAWVPVYPEYVIRLGEGDTSAREGMIASAHPLATQAGLDILKQGGNAVDAAVATAFALSVVEPNASGLGGGGFMIVKMVGKSPIVIDYREVAPRTAHKNFYYNQEKTFRELAILGSTAVAVPGMPLGMETALVECGSKTLSEVLQPAIKLAKEGFVVNSKMSDMIFNFMDAISSDDITAAVFFDEDGLPLEPGSVLKRPDLQKTFELFCREGVQPFYNGVLAQAITKTLRDQGGLLTLEDLKNYRVFKREPVRGVFRGYEIISMPPPSSGGMHLIQLLNILEQFDLKKMGHNSAAYIHCFVEAAKQVYADRAAYAADPEFYPVPVDNIIDIRYAKSISQHIKPDHVNRDVKAGAFLRSGSDTTHLSVVDKSGNLVALTQTINHFFGSGVTVPEYGILLNDEMVDFSEDSKSKNAVEPGKRPVSTMAPTLVYKDGKPFLTIGTPGGSRIITALAQILINIIEFEMTLDAAIEAPRIHWEKETLHLESRIGIQVQQELKKLGHKLNLRGEYDVYFGGAQGILIDTAGGRLIGGADSRRSGTAAGY
ncbi:MAG: gamma-glutamyltransferase [Acidobacteria bacterium]|nr:MAG: gamma-glutamyltransferase [Acidobacteriota bacterium]